MEAKFQTPQPTFHQTPSKKSSASSKNPLLNELFKDLEQCLEKSNRQINSFSKFRFQLHQKDKQINEIKANLKTKKIKKGFRVGPYPKFEFCSNLEWKQFSPIIIQNNPQICLNTQ